MTGRSESAADLVVLDAKVLTLNATDEIAESIAITDGTISYVGPTAGARTLIGPHTTVVDAAKATVIPGINDSHHHLSAVSLNLPPACLGLRPEAVSSVAEICELVRERAASQPAGTWIVGSGWHGAMLIADEPNPRDTSEVFTRHLLDEAAPDHPVALIDFSYHNVWANTRALELAGVDTSRPNDDEYVVADASGRPSGLLKEAAQARVFSVLPKRSPEVIEAALLEGAMRLNELGITSVTEPGLGRGGELFAGGTAGPEVIEAYRRLSAQGRLNLRVNVLLLPSPTPQAGGALEAALSEFESQRLAGESADERHLRIAGVKIFADGVPMFRTSCFHDAYAGSSAAGSLSVAGRTDAEREQQLAELIRIAHTRGYQVGVHATGDRTADLVAQAFASAIESAPRDDPRHYLIHGSFATESCLDSLGRSGLGMNWSPVIHYSFAEANIDVVGRERVDRFGPVKTALDHGVHVACSSDAPIGSADWRGALASLLDRKTVHGSEIGGDQQLTLLDGLRCYTIGGAWQDHADTWKGSLEVGKVADLVVLDGDLLHMTPDQIREIRILRTYLDGELVYTA